MRKFLIKIISTFFGLGYLPVAPGTWGTLGAFVLWVFCCRHMDPRIYAIVVIVLTWLGVYVSGLAEKKLFKKHDSPHIVIDEVCGYFVSMMGLSTGIYWGIAGFILFRIFDIWKPFPVNKAQNLPRGLGIMADDVMAGIYVLIILNAAGYFLL